jgi:DMSO/TMAO reductase YedYZ molybdopterin-dependent catalytic subunit
MDTENSSRRDFVVQGGAAFAGLTLLHAPFLAQAFPSQKGEEVVPWLDQPPDNPAPDAVRNLLRWEDLDSWVTPNDEFFAVNHYNWPVIDERAWRLEIGGLVRGPMTFTLSELTADHDARSSSRWNALAITASPGSLAASGPPDGRARRLPPSSRKPGCWSTAEK